MYEIHMHIMVYSEKIKVLLPYSLRRSLRVENSYVIECRMQNADIACTYVLPVCFRAKSKKGVGTEQRTTENRTTK